MVDLHERLSEFSYGYGVTREVEKLLASVGLNAVPFLPSLLQEATLGFDVGFNKKGAPLLIQFKLGQVLARYRRSTPTETIPVLARPFWRFWVDTSEQDGQYEALLKAELDGAETYYAAPRFSNWTDYGNAFQAEAVLQQSLLIKPTEIREGLDAQGVPDGWHKVVYDGNNRYVCSEPLSLREVRPAELAQTILARIVEQPLTLAETCHRIFLGLADRSPVRRKAIKPHIGRTGEEHELEVSMVMPLRDAAKDRQQRLDDYRSRAKSEDDAIATSLAVEMWTTGIQTIFAAEQ